MTTSVIITMAGEGERFRRRGYPAPKYRIEARGRTLFRWSLESLRQFLEAGAEVVFAARAEHEPDEFLDRECRQLGIGRYRVLRLKAPTDGQATTALLAGALLASDRAPCLIYNIDTYVEPQWLVPSRVRGDGWIPCFPAEGDGWSFALAEADGRVLQVAEKRRISSQATIGLYWFSSFQLYRRLYARHFAAPGGVEAGERYIAPMYNTLLAEGGRVCLEAIPAEVVHPLGTPDQVEEFMARGGAVACPRS